VVSGSQEVTVLKLVSGERVVAILFGRGKMGMEVRRKKKEGGKAGRILEVVMSFIAHDLPLALRTRVVFRIWGLRRGEAIYSGLFVRAGRFTVNQLSP
jgi:hypothetical protein